MFDSEDEDQDDEEVDAIEYPSDDPYAEEFSDEEDEEDEEAFDRWAAEQGRAARNMGQVSGGAKWLGLSGC